MEALEFLRQAICIDKEIKHLERLLRCAQDAAQFPPKTNNEFQKSGYSEINPIEKVGNYSLMLKNAKIECEKKKAEIESVIEKVPTAKYRVVLRVRYLEDGTWSDVADAIGYESEYWVRVVIHEKALNCVKEILKNSF